MIFNYLKHFRKCLFTDKEKKVLFEALETKLLSYDSLYYKYGLKEIEICKNLIKEIIEPTIGVYLYNNLNFILPKKEDCNKNLVVEKQGFNYNVDLKKCK